MPTIVFTKRGQEVDRVVGANVSQIQQILGRGGSSAAGGSSFSGKGQTLSGKKPAQSSSSSNQDNSTLYMFGVIGLMLFYFYLNQNPKKP